MKKTFEFILVLIIFYGVYTAFEKASVYLSKDLSIMWVIFAALLSSALLLFIYRMLISQETKLTLKEKMDSLEKELVKEKENVSLKDVEIKKAQSFKKDLISEAESLIEKE